MAAGPPADRMNVGDSFAPLEFTVTPELNQQYLFAEEEFHPRYYEVGPWGDPLVHPSLVFNMSNITRSPSFRTSPGSAAIHTGEETTFHMPARVGWSLRVTWTVVDAFERRGRPYHVHEAHITTTEGAPVMSRRLWHTYSSVEHEVS
ncbi:MAG: MaoC family dehydratase N-terminal domain-containing protein [Microbacteriaceae bacterium]|nr:MaoC family dehydratase N-terminal domain-containing protein [Microbacteriaceae bacterium]